MQNEIMNIVYLYLWNINTQTQTLNRIAPVTSHAKKAQEICGTLSKNMSGSGGYFFTSGTLSCTTTITKAVIQVTKKA